MGVILPNLGLLNCLYFQKGGNRRCFCRSGMTKLKFEIIHMNEIYLFMREVIVQVDVQSIRLWKGLGCILYVSTNQFFVPLTIMCWHICWITHRSCSRFLGLVYMIMNVDLSPLCFIYLTFEMPKHLPLWDVYCLF